MPFKIPAHPKTREQSPQRPFSVNRAAILHHLRAEAPQIAAQRRRFVGTRHLHAAENQNVSGGIRRVLQRHLRLQEVLSVRFFSTFLRTFLRFSRRFMEHSLLATTRNDGHVNRRLLEQRELSARVQNILETLQHPTDCDNQKFLQCRCNLQDCGWGCQAHHVVECLAQAVGMQRSLVFKPVGFKYGNGSLERAFRNFSPRYCNVGPLKRRNRIGSEY